MLKSSQSSNWRSSDLQIFGLFCRKLLTDRWNCVLIFNDWFKFSFKHSVRHYMWFWNFFSFISLSSLRLVKIKCTKILIQMFTSGQSDNSHLKCLLEQQNIVGVWRLASDPITPHWYVYTDMFIHRYWGVMSRTSWTPSRSLQVDAGGAPRTCSNTDGCFCSLTRPPNWQDAFGRWVWRVGHVMCVAVQLEWSAWRVFPLLKHKILWNVQKH